MVILKVNAQSLYGERITRSLKAAVKVLNEHCSCPPEQSCSVEITELPGRRFEAIVTRPGSVAECPGWTAMPAGIKGKYRQLFEKRASEDEVRESLSAIVGAPLIDS